MHSWCCVYLRVSKQPMSFRSALTYMAGYNGKNVELGVHWTCLISAAWLFLWCPFLFTTDEEDNRPREWWNPHPTWWANEFAGFCTGGSVFRCTIKTPMPMWVTTQTGWIIGALWENSTSTLVTENLFQIIIYSVYRLKSCLSFPYPKRPNFRNSSCRWSLLLWVKRKQPQNKSYLSIWLK